MPRRSYTIYDFRIYQGGSLVADNPVAGAFEVRGRYSPTSADVVPAPQIWAEGPGFAWAAVGPPPPPPPSAGVAPPLGSDEFEVALNAAVGSGQTLYCALAIGGWIYANAMFEFDVVAAPPASPASPAPISLAALTERIRPDGSAAAQSAYAAKAPAQVRAPAKGKGKTKK